MASNNNRFNSVQPGESYIEILAEMGLYRAALLSMAGVGLVALGAILWAIGSFFTVEFIHLFLPDLGIWAWAVPVIISAIEVALLEDITQSWLGYGIAFGVDFSTNLGGLLSFFLGLVLAKKLPAMLIPIIIASIIFGLGLSYGRSLLLFARYNQGAGRRCVSAGGQVIFHDDT